MELKTRRLILGEVTEQDLDPLVSAFQSNPDFLERREGAVSVVGPYRRDKLGRDLAVADLDPAREVLAIRSRVEEPPIGMVDLLREHPHDGTPWLGLVLIHAEQQRQGYAREVVAALAHWMGKELDAAVMGAAVDEDDERARAFLRATGFREVGRRWRRGPAGDVVVSVQELTIQHHDEAER